MSEMQIMNSEGDLCNKRAIFLPAPRDRGSVRPAWRRAEKFKRAISAKVGVNAIVPICYLDGFALYWHEAPAAAGKPVTL